MFLHEKDIDQTFPSSDLELDPMGEGGGKKKEEKKWVTIHIL